MEELRLDKAPPHERLRGARSPSHDSPRPAFQRPPLPADSRPEPGARPDPQGDEPAHHRSPRTRVRRPRQARHRRHAAGLPDPPSGRHLRRLGHRRLGSRAQQPDEPGRCGADVRDRPVRLALAPDRLAPRPQARVPERAGHRPGDRPALVVAQARAARPDRGTAPPGPRARDPRRLRGAQRDLHRRDLRHRRGAQGDRRRRPSGAAPGRHDLRPRLRRLPARRVGRRRRHGRLAEGPDDAARHLLQRLVAQGDRGEQGGDAAQGLLGLGRDRRDEQGRLLAVDAEHESALRLVGGARHAPRPGAGGGVRPPPALGRGGARRGPGLGPADPVRRRGRPFAGAHGSRHAARASMPMR